MARTRRRSVSEESNVIVISSDEDSEPDAAFGGTVTSGSTKQTRKKLLAELDCLRRAHERIPVVLAQLNALSPSARLPPELAARIFEYCLSFTDLKRYDQLDRLRFVCRRWNDVIVNSPRLWVTIDDSGWQRADILLERSGMLPLNLKLTWTEKRKKRQYDPRKADIFRWLIDVGEYRRFTGRLRSISLVLLDKELPCHKILRGLDCCELPLLEVLEIRTNAIDQILQNFHKKSSRLRFVALENVDWRQLGKDPPPAIGGLPPAPVGLRQGTDNSKSIRFYSLEELHLTHNMQTFGMRCMQSVETLLELLIGFKHLRVLHLHGAGYPFDEQNAETKVTLPHLQDLTIAEFNMGSPFRSLPKRLIVPQPYRLRHNLLFSEYNYGAISALLAAVTGAPLPPVPILFDTLPVPLIEQRPTSIVLKETREELHLSLSFKDSDAPTPFRSLTFSRRVSAKPLDDHLTFIPNSFANTLFAQMLEYLSRGAHTTELQAVTLHGGVVEYFFEELIRDSEHPRHQGICFPELQRVEIWDMPESELSIMRIRAALDLRRVRGYKLWALCFMRSRWAKVILREDGEHMRDLRRIVDHVQVQH